LRWVIRFDGVINAYDGWSGGEVEIWRVLGSRWVGCHVEEPVIAVHSTNGVCWPFLEDRVEVFDLCQPFSMRAELEFGNMKDCENKSIGRRKGGGVIAAIWIDAGRPYKLRVVPHVLRINDGGNETEMIA